jgi:hypothetical protein
LFPPPLVMSHFEQEDEGAIVVQIVQQVAGTLLNHVPIILTDEQLDQHVMEEDKNSEPITNLTISIDDAVDTGGLQQFENFDRWARVVEVANNPENNASNWTCPIDDCHFKSKSAPGLKCHITRIHKEYSYSKCKADRFTVVRDTKPTPYLQGVFDSCKEIERLRDEAKQRPRVTEQRYIAPVRMLERLKITDEIILDINGSEEFIRSVGISYRQINHVLSLVDQQDGIINLKNVVASSGVEIRNVILEMAKSRIVNTNTGNSGNSSGESRSAKSIRFKMKEIRNILKYRMSIRSNRRVTRRIQNYRNFLIYKCRNVRREDLYGKSDEEVVRYCNKVVSRLRREISQSQDRLKNRLYRKRLLQLYKRNRTRCFEMLMEGKEPERKVCPIPKEDLEAFFNREAQGSKSLDMPFVRPPYFEELEKRGLLPAKCSEDENEGQEFSMKELAYHISRSKKNSAPGFDGISNAYIKGLTGMHHWLLLIFEICRKYPECIPEEWKSGHVSLLYKKGDEMDPGNWRPICLLINIYKLFSIMVSGRYHLHDKQLKLKYGERGGLFSPCQRGFKPGHDGTMTNMSILRTILEALKTGESRWIGVTFVDFCNAFGSVDHSRILETLNFMNVPNYLVNISKHLYTNTFFQVAYGPGGKQYTDPTCLERGVKQGCGLSPTKFNVFLEPLLRWLQVGDTGVKLFNETVSVLGYADDICTTTEGIGETKITFEKIVAFGAAVDINLKPSKCASVLTSIESRKVTRDPKLVYKGAAVPLLKEDASYRFLGCETDVQLTFKNVVKDIDVFLLKSLRRLHASPLLSYQKIALFKQCVLPKISFPLHAAVVPITWIRKKDIIIRKYLRKWCGLIPGASSDFFHISAKLGGLGVPSLEDEAMRRMSSAKIRSLLGNDSESRDAAMFSLRSEQKFILDNLLKFQLVLNETDTEAVNFLIQEINWPNIRSFCPSLWNKTFNVLATCRKKLCDKLKYRGWSKVFIEFEKLSWTFWNGSIKDTSGEEDVTINTDKLQQVMMRKLQVSRVKTWVGKVKHGARRKAELEHAPQLENEQYDIGETLPQSYDWLRKPYMLKEQEYHWAIKVKLDILPCRANLHKWKLSRNKNCMKCRNTTETTHHVLNGCPWRLNKKLYTIRHNAIQDLIAEEITKRIENTSPSQNRNHDPNELILCDKVPLPEFSTSNLRPDLQLMKFIEDPQRKSNFMVDFKCPDTLTRDYRGTHRRNVEKYSGLVNNATEWNSSIETFIVSSNGVVPKCSLTALKSLEYSAREAQRTIARASFLAIKQSYKLLRKTL